MRFPWPEDDTDPTPRIQVVASDPVWIGALQRVFRHPAQASLEEVQLVVTQHSDLADASHANSLLNCFETDLSEVERIASYLADRPRSLGQNLVVLLARDAFADSHDRRLAKTILHEAGVRLVLGSPQQSHQVGQLAELLLMLKVSVTSDPLAELPLPCWDPAWQQGQSGDRV